MPEPHDRIYTTSCDSAELSAGEVVPTSSISAPGLVGAMLELLDLRPGMRVLEIGTGSGYNAALLREVVGPQGSVTSLDLDADLVAEATKALLALGREDIHLVDADGYFGAPEDAPFDRIVATVGCTDLAPAWLEQLAPGGLCLLPLQHGGWHPLMRIHAGGGEALGRVVGCSGFVSIQGHQPGSVGWARSGWTTQDRDPESSPLPDELATKLRPDTGKQPLGGPGAWDLALMVALEDRRARSVLTLAGDDSAATIHAAEGRVGWSGPAGGALADRLLEIAHHWLALGQPRLADYESRFQRLDRERMHGAGANDLWVVDRFDYRQTVVLNPNLGEEFHDQPKG